MVASVVDDDIRIERDPDDPSRLHITAPDPRPGADELADLRALVQGVMQDHERAPGETDAEYGERIRYLCGMLLGL